MSQVNDEMEQVWAKANASLAIEPGCSVSRPTSAWAGTGQATVMRPWSPARRSGATPRRTSGPTVVTAVRHSRLATATFSDHGGKR